MSGTLGAGSMAPQAGADFLTPMKVELNLSPAPVTPSPRPCFKDMAPPTLNYACSFSTGEWATVVHSVAPYLSSQGLRRALTILDQATQNVQRLKALDEVIKSTHEAEAFANFGYSPLPYAQCTVTCMALQEQLRDQQLRLLLELQQMPLDTKSVRRDFYEALTSSVPASPCVLPPHLMSIFNNAMRNIAGNAETAFVAPTTCGTNPTPAGNAASPAAQAVPAAPASSWQPSTKAQPAGGQAARPAAARKMQTLSSSLQLLSDEDPDCLFIVRRINKLGFKAVRTLKRQFSAQGQVLKVLLAHSTVRQHGAPQCHARRRPSSLGFVQMATAEGAQKVLALGDEQEVDGIPIRVQRFERQRYAEVVAEEAEAAGEAEEPCEFEGPEGSTSTGHVKSEKDNGFERQISEASTTATVVSSEKADSGPDSEES